VASTPVVSVEGVIDLATIPALHAHLLRAVADHPGSTVVIDLDAVTALDDCGLGILLGAAGRARESGGDLTVVVTSDRLRERFRSTGLDRAIEVRERL
jgi:anti-sigma B factor antagonist